MGSLVFSLKSAELEVRMFPWDPEVTTFTTDLQAKWQEALLVKIAG